MAGSSVMWQPKTILRPCSGAALIEFLHEQRTLARQREKARS
jgi:hypothetical protein